MPKYEDHPLAALFPLMPNLTEMVEDMKGPSGLVNAIILFQGKILDGRNRYRACMLAGIEPRFEEYTGSDPLAFVISQNLPRRHLNESQRAMVAAEIIKTKQCTGANHPANLRDGPTQGKTAELLNVSERSVNTAAKVLANGTPALIDAVKSGEASVSAAATVADLPKSEQKAAVKAGAVAETAAAMKRRLIIIKLVRSIDTKLADLLEADEEITNEELEKAKPLCCDKCDRLGPQLRCTACLDLRTAAKSNKKPLQEGEVEEPQNGKPKKNPDSLAPIVKVHPHDELRALTIKLSGMFTKAMKDGTEEGKRLHDYLSLCTLVEHTSSEDPAKHNQPVFLPLKGVTKIIDLAGQTGRPLSDEKVREAWKTASGYTPPLHARRKAFKAGSKKGNKR